MNLDEQAFLCRIESFGCVPRGLELDYVVGQFLAFGGTSTLVSFVTAAICTPTKSEQMSRFLQCMSAFVVFLSSFSS